MPQCDPRDQGVRPARGGLVSENEGSLTPPPPAPSHKVSQPNIHCHPAQAGVNSEVTSSPIMHLLMYPLNRTFTEHLLRAGPCDACEKTTWTDGENGSVVPGDTAVP